MTNKVTSFNESWSTTMAKVDHLREEMKRLSAKQSKLREVTSSLLDKKQWILSKCILHTAKPLSAAFLTHFVTINFFNEKDAFFLFARYYLLLIWNWTCKIVALELWILPMKSIQWTQMAVVVLVQLLPLGLLVHQQQRLQEVLQLLLVVYHEAKLYPQKKVASMECILSVPW